MIHGVWHSLVDFDTLHHTIPPGSWLTKPLWKIWKSIGMSIPNTWENISYVPVTTNQPLLASKETTSMNPLRSVSVLATITGYMSWYASWYMWYMRIYICIYIYMVMYDDMWWYVIYDDKKPWISGQFGDKTISSTIDELYKNHSPSYSPWWNLHLWTHLKQILKPSKMISQLRLPENHPFPMKNAGFVHRFFFFYP